MIDSKKIGAYTLYKSSERDFYSARTILLTYIALLTGIKENFQGDSEGVIKKIGKKFDDYVRFPIGSDFPEEVTRPAEKGVYRPVLEYYADRYTYMDYIINKDVEVEAIFESDNKVIYKLYNAKYLNEIEGFYLHFYVVAGIFETVLERVIGKKIECSINRVENQEVDLLIEVKV
ncbi:MAG: hypothetical protein GF353_09935 [Candidatus Lokiarchaeota archaeon]|nr:hypothetical protein [Candidatus Lokiarchaeota archaeon]